MSRFPIAREGFPFILGAALLTLVTVWLAGWWAVLPGLLLAFVTFFFRDPERQVPSGEDTLVSPADGRVMWVKRVYESRYLQSEATLVSIFLSPADVHLNRAPLAGRVEYVDYVPGKYLVAYADKASEINERNYIGINSGRHKVLVVQIAGLVARRIVCWPKVGDWLEKGQRFGLIKFGSCTQVYLPPGMEATVVAGQRVVGGSTVVGRVSRETASVARDAGAERVAPA